MATESNSGVNFHHHHHHQVQAVSFQPSTVSEFGNFYSSYHGHGVNLNVNVSNTAGGIVQFSGTPTGMISCSSNNNSGIPQPGLLLDTVPGLKHDAGLDAEWSVEEQYKLEEGLAKFADEPSIMKYIKIAAILRDKTVRDVALRCRWMTRKRRKLEDHNLGKKVKDRRDRIESCLKTNITSPSPMNMAAYSIPLQARNQSDATSSVSALIGTISHLLEENSQVLGQISANLTTLEMKFDSSVHQQLQENVDLFLQTRSNLVSILNDMRNMPGIMSQMPPLPVFINEELASYILPSSTQCMMFGSPSGLLLKREPGC